jgi:hypothetical protein
MIVSQLSIIYLVTESSVGQLPSGINSQFPLPLSSIGCTYQAMVGLQPVVVKSRWFRSFRYCDNLHPIGIRNSNEIVSLSDITKSINISIHIADAISSCDSV